MIRFPQWTANANILYVKDFFFQFLVKWTMCQFNNILNTTFGTVPARRY